jgi:hypothetical protein
MEFACLAEVRREAKEKKPQIPSLRYAEFPVEAWWISELHAALLKESRTRGHVW